MRMPAYSKVARHGEITAPASVRMELRVEEADQNIKAGRVNALVSPEDLIEDLGKDWWLPGTFRCHREQSEATK
jgi:hypothetical protein